MRSGGGSTARGRRRGRSTRTAVRPRRRPGRRSPGGRRRTPPGPGAAPRASQAARKAPASGLETPSSAAHRMASKRSCTPSTRSLRSCTWRLELESTACRWLAARASSTGSTSGKRPRRTRSARCSGRTRRPPRRRSALVQEHPHPVAALPLEVDLPRREPRPLPVGDLPPPHEGLLDGPYRVEQPLGRRDAPACRRGRPACSRRGCRPERSRPDGPPYDVRRPPAVRRAQLDRAVRILARDPLPGPRPRRWARTTIYARPTWPLA